ncbi:hypothetical protein vseg_007951 [Gypsophila vaccaria]
MGADGHVVLTNFRLPKEIDYSSRSNSLCSHHLHTLTDISSSRNTQREGKDSAKGVYRSTLFAQRVTTQGSIKEVRQWAARSRRGQES